MARHFNEQTVLWAPVPVTQKNSTELGLTRSAAMTRPNRPPIIGGVHAHPWAIEDFMIPSWADERWKDIRLQTAALQLIRPDAVLSHASAAHIHGLPVPDRLSSGGIHVTTHPDRLRRTGFSGHVASNLRFIYNYRIAVAHPLDVLRQISGLLDVDELVAVVDALSGPWHGPAVAKPDEIQKTMAAGPRFRGSRTLMKASRLARTGVGSPRETELRLRIVSAGLPEPAVTTAVTLAGQTYHPDLSYPHLRIAIEYEGLHHLGLSREWDRGIRRQWKLDIKRERAFNDHGWKYIRVTADDDDDEFLIYLRRLITERTVAFNRHDSTRESTI